MSYALRIFFDGRCPLCAREMNQLKRLDTAGKLDLQDIHAYDFAQRFPHINPVAADKILHGETADGQLLLGLDVTCRGWQLVGRGHWFMWMRWPLIRPVADQVYLLFARHRHRISRWFGRRDRVVCDERCRPQS